jgi:hypothetical protein
MKTKYYIHLLTFAGIIALAACNNVTVSTGDGSHKITGNGKLTTETRDVKPFNAISIEGVFNIILKQGNKESIQIESDENILPVIITNSENDTLRIKMKDSASISNMDKLNVYVTLVSVSCIENKGVGTLKCNDTLHLKNIQLTCEGAGTTNLKLYANKLTVNSEIVGAILLSGVTKETFIHHNGVGAIRAFDLKTENLTLEASGVGAAEVFASQELTINADGIGGIQYKGGASKKQITNDGIGKVVCVDCK